LHGSPFASSHATPFGAAHNLPVVPRLADEIAHAYLERLGVDARPGAVDVPTLRALQEAHVEHVVYETLDIVRGVPPEIEPLACVDRIVAGRGGYCYHLNGAFATLLEWLDVDVMRHLAGVQGRDVPVPPGANGNHLGLTVRTPDGDEWLVDVGLGTGPARPLPLVQGVHEQDGFRYELRPSELAPDGWRFEHDPRGGFIRFDVAPGPATTGDFLAMHADLSTGRFAHTVTAQRRVAGQLQILRGCVYQEIDPRESHSREITAEDEWWDLVLGHFGLSYGGLDPAERGALWRRVIDRHAAWEAEGRP
jgi:N-hydroxyarylamine O-acetyltransferase